MNPTLYEISTRLWIRQFGEDTSLSQIPDTYWKHLKSKGVDYVWLMGVWHTTPSSINKYCFHPDLVKAYDAVSERWTLADITGSPYAVEDYVISPLLGETDDLIFVKKQLNRLGIRLILDFIPNHFNSDSGLLDTNPDVFLQVDQYHYENDQETFFKHQRYHFAHGKDPYFAAWSDTVQVNYFNPVAHQFMQDRLLYVAELCDGVRCDMAMLILPEIFEKTWGYTSSNRQHLDFWSKAIARVRSYKKDFIFLAEAYWNTEWHLQQVGFDYTYDKRFLDLIKEGDISELKNHLSGAIDYQNKTIRFIENHDEERSITALGDMKSRAAAVLSNCLPGMRLHFDGQWDGKRVRYPVQIGTNFPASPCPCTIRQFLPDGSECPCSRTHYDRLLQITSDPLFKYGEWQLILPTEGSGDCIVVQWNYQSEEKLVAVNLGNQPIKIKITTPSSMHTGTIRDVLNQIENPGYLSRQADGLHLNIPAFKACILMV
jgi:hypothetical protein